MVNPINLWDNMDYSGSPHIVLYLLLQDLHSGGVYFNTILFFKYPVHKWYQKDGTSSSSYQ